MQIRKITADNFKSLVDFEMALHDFNCLIGLNGSGKSTLLQFMDFLARQVQGGIDDWLLERDWKAGDMLSKLGSHSKKLITFSVEFISDSGCRLDWHASFNTDQLRCTRERLVLHLSEGDQRLLNVADGRFTLNGQGAQPIRFAYQGSILSQLLDKELPAELKEFKQFFQHFRSLELLAPHSLRQKVRKSEGKVGLGGERLSAFIHEMPDAQKARLMSALREAYPKLSGIQTRSQKGGWKALDIGETFADHSLRTEARHINDGMLRMLAVLAQLMAEHSFVAFDEVENGINPELIEYLIDRLVAAKQQVMVTTHSPLVLNFMEDSVAIQSVQYLYKTREGRTRSIPFFDIPSLKGKLEVMGPGEAFIDTNLVALSDEISSLSRE